MIRRLLVKFDNVAARIGKGKGYRKAYWWYKTQDTYFSTGMGKLFVPLQFSALFGNIGLIFLVAEKIVPGGVPQLLYKLLPFFVVIFFFSCLFIGRFMDKSYSFELEQEWGNQRNPLAKELRKKLNIKPKYAIKTKKY